MTEEQRKAIDLIKDLSIEEIYDEWKTPKKKPYLLQLGEQYLDFDGNGDLYDNEWDGSDYNKFEISTIKKFKSEDDTVDYIKYLQAYMKIINAIREANEGWKPNWDDDSKDKYIVTNFRPGTCSLDISAECIWQSLPNELYIKNPETAERLMEELEDEYKLIFNYDNFNWLEVE